MPTTRPYKPGVIRPKRYSAPTRNIRSPAGKRGTRKSSLLIIGVIISSVAIWMIMWFQVLPESNQNPTAVRIESPANIRGSLQVENEEMLQHNNLGDDDDEIEVEEDIGEEDTGEEEHSFDSDDHVSIDDEENAVSLEQDEEMDNTHEDIMSQEENVNEFELPPLRNIEAQAITLENFFINLGQKVVNIDPKGSFKYVLVQATDKKGNSGLVVQGCSYALGSRCKHPDAARIPMKKLKSYGIEGKVLGGGRITRRRLRNTKKSGLISIFGYSKTYSKTDGLCEDCNARACELIALAYPNYVVRWSNKGYTEKDEHDISDFTKCSV